MAALEITTMAGCPLLCSFCPQDKLKAAYVGEKYLSLTNFIKVLDKIPPHVRIDFSGMAEPWANPECSDLLEYALSKQFKVAIYTTLYGMKDADRVAALITRYQSQIEVICLHLPDAQGNMTGWKPKEYWFTAFETIIKTQFPRLEAMTMDRNGQIHPSLNRYRVQLPGWQAISRAGSLDTHKPVRATPAHQTKIVCATSAQYDHNVLLPNGDVLLCCMDYAFKHTLGNLFEQEYHELFEGEALKVLKEQNLTPGFSKCSICKSCENVKVVM